MITKTYRITGMTCNGCRESVEKALAGIVGVDAVSVNLDTAEASVTQELHLAEEVLGSALASKFSISEKIKKESRPSEIATQTVAGIIENKSKIQQLKPLFLIFGYLLVATFLRHYKSGSLHEAMLDFMGLFYIVFSFFKLLDLKGFKNSFQMYDPLAKKMPVYGWIYPFIELILGLMFLLRFETNIALLATLVVLGITSIGVIKTLLDKKTIRCACLGTALKLPMTEATVIENAIMIVMASLMLLNIV